MVEISAIGPAKDLFQHCQDRIGEFLSALLFRLGVSIICRMLEVSAEAVVHSNKEMARFGTSLIGRGRVHSLQLLLPRPLYKRVVDRRAEMGRVFERHHHRGATGGHRRDLDLQDANFRKSLSLNEHPQPQSSTTSGEPR